jgi:hypothetical protein
MNDVYAVLARRKNTAIVMIENLIQAEEAGKDNVSTERVGGPQISSINDMLAQEDLEIWEKNQPISLLAISKGWLGSYHLVDPQRTGKVLRAHDYFQSWIRFIIMAFQGNSYPLNIVQDILRNASSLYSKDELLVIIDQLWRDRWVIDCHEVGRLRLSILASDMEDLEQLKRGSYPDKAFAVFEDELNHAKEDSQSLDEWLEALYGISSLVHCLYMIYQTDSSEEGRKRHRFIDEVGADIGTIITSCITEWASGNSLIMSKRFLLDPLSETSDLRQLRRELSYKYNARVFYPKYWYDLAWDYVNSDRQNLPDKLDKVDFIHLSSLGLTHSLLAKEAFFGIKVRLHFGQSSC